MKQRSIVYAVIGLVVLFLLVAILMPSFHRSRDAGVSVDGGHGEVAYSVVGEEEEAPKAAPPVASVEKSASVSPGASMSVAARDDFLIDNVLSKLKASNIAFNTPKVLKYRERTNIELVLNPSKETEELIKEITADGAIEHAQIIVSNRMKAELKGEDFDIKTVTPEVQAISGIQTTQWLWQVTPTSNKNKTASLFLTLTALIKVDGKETLRTIKTFQKEIEVKVSVKSHITEFLEGDWKWLLSTIVIPLFLWYRKKKASKQGDKA